VDVAAILVVPDEEVEHDFDLPGPGKPTPSALHATGEMSTKHTADGRWLAQSTSHRTHPYAQVQWECTMK
jgi:hypothetical protein